VGLIRQIEDERIGAVQSHNALLQNWDEFWESGVKSFEGEVKYSLRSAHGRLTVRELQQFPGGRILEAGCGIGNWISILQTRGYHAFGVDISESSLQVAKKFCGANALLWHGDIRSLAVAGASFDAIVSYGVIEHFTDPLSAVREFYRTLRPGGLCIVTTPNPLCFHGLIGRHVLNLTRSRRLGYTGYEDSYTPKQLSNLLSRAGFQVLQRGLLPEGALFGMFWPLVPVVGNAIYHVFKRISLFIETKQPLVGTGSYVIGCRP
jgi:2-polyprenyl-3-methyl-5-hydroxy-6-metoxy-1,4-benzoquinol methylase